MSKERSNAVDASYEQGKAGRVAFAITISVLVALYTLGIILGYIPKERQIDGSNIAIIFMALLAVILVLKPEVFTRLKALEIANVKIDLYEAKQKLRKQDNELEEINNILPLLLPKTEREHLLNLSNGQTRYEGKSTLRTELRHLRSMDLIRMKSGHHIEDTKNIPNFDLANYVELTEFGKYWVKRINQREQVETDEDAKTNGETSRS